MDKKTEIVKPLSVRRYNCIQDVCTALNNAELPAFVLVEVLEKVMSEMRNLMDLELQRDLAAYAEQTEQAKAEEVEA